MISILVLHPSLHASISAVVFSFAIQFLVFKLMPWLYWIVNISTQWNHQIVKGLKINIVFVDF